MKGQQKAKIQQAIALLQQALSGETSPSGPTYPPMTDFDQKLQHFQALAQKLEPEIIELTKVIVGCFGTMKEYLSAAANSKKPDETASNKLMGVFKKDLGVLQEIGKKEAFTSQAKAITQCCGAAFWVFTDAPKVVIDNAIESADFDANKFRKKGVAAHNEWYNAVIAALKSLVAYTLENYKSGITYNFHGTASWDDFLSGKKSAPAAKPTSAPQTKVEAPKKEQAPKVAKSVRQEKGSNWYVQNWQNTDIAFTKQEIKMNNNFFIEGCKNVKIDLSQNKMKALRLSKIEKATIEVKDCVSGVEIMSSKGVELRVLGWCPSINIDSCTDMKVILNSQNKNTDLISCKTSQLTITHVDSEGEMAKQTTVSDQLITRWNDTTKKYQSKVYDQFI